MLHAARGLQCANRGLQHADAGLAQPDGELLQPDGELLQPDGELVHPDGELVRPDGELVHPARALIHAAEELVHRPKGSKHLAGDLGQRLHSPKPQTLPAAAPSFFFARQYVAVCPTCCTNLASVCTSSALARTFFWSFIAINLTFTNSC